jgi:hypothetical protein
MLAPDHWVPLTLYCHTKGYSTGRTSMIAAAGGLAHVAGSIITMAVAIFVGLALALGFSQFSNYAIGVSFAVIAVYMAFSGFRASETEEGRVELSRGAKWLVLATASSPEPTIFPIYLSASVRGLGLVVASISAFTFGTVVSIVLVTLARMKGLGLFLRAPGREKQIDYAIALVMAGLAIFILAGG